MGGRGYRIMLAGAVTFGTLILGPATQARGIDCAKAATRLEKTICADPVLLDYDGQIAGLYAQALGAWKGAIAAYVRRDQAIWLAHFRMIGARGEEGAACDIADKACIREEMQRRVEALDSGTYANSGVYMAADGRKLLLSPRHGNGYALRVFDPAHLPDVHVTTLDAQEAAMWDGPDFMVAQMGDGNGAPLPRPMGGPEPDGCTLRMAPSALSMRVWQKGYCGGRDYAGVYRRDLAQTLADYDVDLH